MVRRHGILIYSTCSLETEENETIVSDFCEKHPDFAVSELKYPGYPVGEQWQPAHLAAS
jgi:16S rRNA (cytosine967-C5)-methyltransferase